MSEAVLTPEMEAPPVSPGAQLAAAREARGLSVADIAQQLKLSPSQVEALETDDYRRLPSPVFVRGFIRNYARLVKLDAATLLAHMEQELPRAAPVSPAMSYSTEIPFPTARGFGWQKYAIAAIVIAIPLVIFEFYSDDGQPPAVSSNQLEVPAPKIVAETPLAETAPVPPLAPTVAPAPLSVPAAAVQVTAVSVPPPATSAPSKEMAPVSTLPKPVTKAVDQPPAKVATARGEQVVRLRFSRESWVEIRDRDGRKIFSQLNSRGTEQVVSGVPPLSIIIGNANGVQLIHNEQPVDLGPHTKVDVARLTLD
jgi:cytoskeleton protein RodZ